MTQLQGRRTHRDPTVVRHFETSDAYWEETNIRRHYSIPHSDGSFFSDGSGYSNGPESDLQHEIIERLREVALRLEKIDLAALDLERSAQTNADFIPYAADIEEDIRLTRVAVQDLQAEDISDSKLTVWLHTFAHLAGKFVGRGLALCDIFLENAATEGGKQFGKTAVQAGGLALALYLAGTDFHGIATTIAALIASKRPA